MVSYPRAIGWFHFAFFASTLCAFVDNFRCFLFWHELCLRFPLLIPPLWYHPCSRLTPISLPFPLSPFPGSCPCSSFAPFLDQSTAPCSPPRVFISSGRGTSSCLPYFPWYMWTSLRRFQPSSYLLVFMKQYLYVSAMCFEMFGRFIFSLRCWFQRYNLTH